MVDDWFNVALRFALYLDLMILFGMPLFAASAFESRDQHTGICRWHARLAAAAAVLGTILSVFSLLAMARQMAGASDYAAITSHVLQMIVTRTGAGISWAVRVVALVVCLAAAVLLRRSPRVGFLVLAGGGAIALATLAWTGHGAMDEGARGAVHLSSDILHLLGAGAWVGALVAFITLAWGSGRPDRSAPEVLARTAAAFARVGTAIVVTLIATGAINYLLVVGPSVEGLVSTVYGRLLSVKLALFAGMLALAAANRYRLAPRLETALASGEHREAARALARSLRSETGLAFTVLALVAWLGTLSPEG